jgi:nicotinamidase-related amidase/type 1 glutamine amidotransferase
MVTPLRIASSLFHFPPIGLAALVLLLAATLSSGPVPAADPTESADFVLQLRSRVETSPGSGRYHAITQPAHWAPEKTAVIVCDMWDLHHCLNAVRRAQELAPRMNRVLEVMRERGATVIHAPSSCMEFYADHPARQRAEQVPRSSELPEEIGQWCYQIPAEEQGEYPIDQSDGGEDDDPLEHQEWAEKLAAMGRNPRAPWKRQMETLDIDDHDYISDDGAEIWSILEQKGIDQVVLVGVHTNMCVLGRPFGLRNMARYGKQVVLMRDMTDTMYNPEMPPFVSHFTGTDLIVAHIEKYVCPTITSDQILGGTSFRFSTDRRPHVVMVIAEPEYETEETLTRYAAEHLGKEFKVSMVYGDERENILLPGLEVLDEADVALISIRRRPLPPEEMERFERFVHAGKGVVGIRTSNHAFSLRGQAPPDGKQTWEAWDQEVFGGNYKNHHGSGPETQVTIAPEGAEHSILQGVAVEELIGKGSLYIVSPLEPGTTPLLIGDIPDKPAEPIAWTHTTSWGGRAFYTSLGHKGDFEQAAFQQLLRNALMWGSGAR